MSHVIPAPGVLFDCDGVLVDSLEAAAIAWDAWAEEWAPGYDFRTQIQHGVRAADTVAQLVHEERLSDAIAALNAAELAIAAETVAIAGSVALTRSLPTSRWAVVTSAFEELALRRLDAAGHARPSVLISADDVTEGKPSPEPYLRGAQALGIAADQCVVFEDAAAGVAAARAAGVRGVVGVGDHLDGAETDWHVHDLTSVEYLNGSLILR